MVGVEVSHTCGLTREGEIGGAGGGVGFSNSGRIREEEGVGFLVTWRVAPSSWRTSLPRSGIGQEGMTRNEWEKGKPSRLQLNRGVRHRRDGVPSTPVTEIWEGVRVPEKDGKTE